MTLFRKKALIWVRAKSEQLASWHDLCNQIKSVFAPVSEQQAARDRLGALRQLNTVSNFAAEFRRLILLLPELPESEKIDKFIRKLKPSIAKEVYLRDPQTLDEALRIAERCDMISWRLRGKPSNFPAFNNSNNSSSGSNDTVPMEIGVTKMTKLTDEERRALMANIGCLYCRKMNAGHFAKDCPTKSKN